MPDRPLTDEVREALAREVAELEKPTQLHDYRSGFHRSPDCPGCMMLARLRARLARLDGMTIVPAAEIERLRTALGWALDRTPGYARVTSYVHAGSCDPSHCHCGYDEARAALDAPKDPA